MATCNNTLVDLGDNAVTVLVPLWKGWTFHHFILLASAIFGLLSLIFSLYLIFCHATHYSKPSEQKHIIRILFMVPVYSTTSFLSPMFYRNAIYYSTLQGLYEVIALTSFYDLIRFAIAPTLHDQKQYFRKLEPRNWIWPISWLQQCTGGKESGIFRRAGDGMTWFDITLSCVFQYVVVDIVMTISATLAQLFGRYCQGSLNPVFAHIWVLVIQTISAFVASRGLEQMRHQLEADLPVLKMRGKYWCIQAVIFLALWQTVLISFLVSSNSPGGGVLKPSARVARPDLLIGIPSLLLCFELSIVSLVHLSVYPWKPYRITPFHDDSDEAPLSYRGGRLGTLAILDVCNPWDLIKSCGRAFKWVFGRSQKGASSDDVYIELSGGTSRPGGKPKDALIHAQQEISRAH